VAGERYNPITVISSEISFVASVSVAELAQQRQRCARPCVTSQDQEGQMSGFDDTAIKKGHACH